MTALSIVVIPPEHIPTGMKAVHIGSPFLSTTLEELSTFGSKKVFVVANNSSRKFIEGDNEKLIDILQSKGLLAAPLCTSIGMGGGEEGLLTACDEAYAADADVVVTVGGGAVQDAGKLIRLWLATKSDTATVAAAAARATVKGIQGVTKRDPMPSLPPQIALPNSFAMAEATHVAGLTTKANTKSGAAHPSLMPTVIIYDPALSTGLPDWVRFGTGLRGVEHAVGAVTHPQSTDEIRSRALEGLTMIHTNLRKLVSNPECPTAQNNLYRGGSLAVRALNTGCYPSLGHLIQNHYSARYNVHQGSCSGILCARILDYHCEVSRVYQRGIAEALGGDIETTTAAKLVRELVATLPAVKNEHAQVGVTEEMLKEFTEWMWENAWSRYNALSPKDFESVEDMYGMLTKPLVDL